jgi:hypothetical protein
VGGPRLPAVHAATLRDDRLRCAQPVSSRDNGEAVARG